MRHTPQRHQSLIRQNRQRFGEQLFHCLGMVHPEIRQLVIFNGRIPAQLPVCRMMLAAPRQFARAPHSIDTRHQPERNQHRG
jgi:hypothetical protein